MKSSLEESRGDRRYVRSDTLTRSVHHPAGRNPPRVLGGGQDSPTLRGQYSRVVDTVVSFWFDFDWVLSNGEPAPFAVVDVAELSEHGLIDELHIVYDTAPLRDTFNNLREES